MVITILDIKRDVKMKLIKRLKQKLMMRKMRKIQNEQWKLLEYRLKMKDEDILMRKNIYD